jgi:hypothetical protein
MICVKTRLKAVHLPQKTILFEAGDTCMANHEVEARLCRWMLRARDLSGNDDLPFTQEFLAEMLGVRRTSVTSVDTLQAAGIDQNTSAAKSAFWMLKV